MSANRTIRERESRRAVRRAALPRYSIGGAFTDSSGRMTFLASLFGPLIPQGFALPFAEPRPPRLQVPQITGGSIMTRPRARG